MQCKIPSTSLKTFTKAITCLKNIGESINFEITPSRFILRTLGEGEASYFQIDFSTKKGIFFEEYNCYFQRDANNNNNNNNNNNMNENESFASTSISEANRTIKVRIKSKIFLSTFRLNDSALSIELLFKTESNKLEIIQIFSYSIRRKYIIYFEDIATILQAEFDTNNENLREISCQSQIFKRVLTNFANNLQEITLILNENGLAIKSFIDATETNTLDSLIQTECHLKKTQHFNKFNLNLPSSLKQIILTVVQKEFKAFLTLCQSLDEPIKMYMTFGGAPILLTNKTPNSLISNNSVIDDDECNKAIHIKLIMATISDEDQEYQEPQQPHQPNELHSNHLSESVALNARRLRREQQEEEEEEDIGSRITPLAQPQSTPSNYNNNTSISVSVSNNNTDDADDADDDDVMIGLPTHGNFNADFIDENNDYLPHQTVNTTQNVNDTEIGENQSSHSRSATIQTSQPSNKSNISINRKKKKTYSMFQPHPDSITPPPKHQQLQNESDQHHGLMNNNNNNNNNVDNANFMVNPPEFDGDGNNRERDRDRRSRQILPLSSSQSVNTGNDGMDSLELQYTISDDRNNHNKRINDGASDYLSSYLDRMGDGSGSMTPTQPVDGGQIAQRFERMNRKRRIQQNHYENDGRAPKRQRYNDDNNNNNNDYNSYTCTLRKKPKSKWQESPDH